MPPEFTILEVLRRHDVPFVVIGGHAVIFHGYRRATEDIDIVWLRSPQAEISLAKALDELGAQYIGDDVDPATGIERVYPVSLAFIQSNHLMMLCTQSQGFVDLFDYVPGCPDADVAEVNKAAIEQQGIRFASVDWLRKMKQASGRLKDLLDLENLPGEPK